MRAPLLARVHFDQDDDDGGDLCAARVEYAAEIPTLYWLSGLTCTDENFCIKAGAFNAAARERVAIVVPDTSPRGAGVAGEDESYDLGSGAGFYVDATAEPWSAHYNMYSYVTQELPALVESRCRRRCAPSRATRWAATLQGRRPDVRVGVGVRAICEPTACPWGEKAHGSSTAAGAAHDATALMANGPFPKLGSVLIDVGTEDNFDADGQLRIESFEAAAAAAGQPTQVRRRAGDHSYFFISTHIADHVEYHAAAMRERAKEELVRRAAAAPAMKPVEQAVGDADGGQAVSARRRWRSRLKEPLSIETITPPKAGEVRVKVVANALCHTDVYTWGAPTRRASSRASWATRRARSSRAWARATSVKPGDHVVPCYTPQCASPECIFCQSPKTNLCPQIRGTQGQGVMPDGTSRFTRADGDAALPLHGLLHLLRVHGARGDLVRQGRRRAPLEKMCLLGCGVSTGLGRRVEHLQGRARGSVAVFGLGAVGLSVIQAAKLAARARIIAIDLNPAKAARRPTASARRSRAPSNPQSAGATSRPKHTSNTCVV